MGGNKNMKTSQLETRTRLYSSEAEIRKDQEAVVNGVFNKNPDFAYLKDSPDLSIRVRTGCMKGIRQGIARFMKARNIHDIRDVFEGDNFSNYFHDDQKYTILEDQLKKDIVLRKKLCDTEKDSVRECVHISEVVGCDCVNEINRKKLVFSGILPSAELDYIDMSDKKDEFN